MGRRTIKLISSGTTRCAIGLVTALLAWPASAQRITEYPVSTVQGSLSGITSGPDGALWYTVRFAGRIDRISTAGVITSPFQSVGSDPYRGITTGPDGAIWFTDNGGERVWRVTTAGVGTDFLEHDLSPSDITAGSDGALWIAYGGLGRLTTDGATFTEFPGVPARLITAGADGALWTLGVSESVFKLVRTTTAGVSTEFPLPIPWSAEIHDLTTGPDGAFWFTRYHENKIARVTDTGSYSEFTIPTPDSRPWGITNGPDGALWFTEEVGNKIGRITTAGVITEFPIPSPDAHPNGIATGPDGNLWFVENQTAAVGRLQPGVPASLQFFSVTPCRAVDTRDPPAPNGGPALMSGVRRNVNLTGLCGVPVGAVAVAVNFTVIDPTSAGDLRAFPPALFTPNTSFVNFPPGRVRAGNGIIRLGPFGDLTLLSAMVGSGTVDVVIDVDGYFE